MSNLALAVAIILLTPVWLSVLANIARALGWFIVGALAPVAVFTLALLGVLGLAWVDRVLGIQTGTTLGWSLLVIVFMAIRSALTWACRQMVWGWLGSPF